MSDVHPEIAGAAHRAIEQQIANARDRKAAEILPEQLTRGRPAGIADDVDPSQLTRRSRREGGFNELDDIPAELIDPNWDYQYFTITVLNQAVDPSELVAAHYQGWRVVEATGKWLELMCPPGYQGRTIDRRGQRLYMRPMHLTLAARKEDEAIAREMRKNKLDQALATPEGTVPRTITQLEVGIPTTETLDARFVRR